MSSVRLLTVLSVLFAHRLRHEPSVFLLLLPSSFSPVPQRLQLIFSSENHPFSLGPQPQRAATTLILLLVCINVEYSAASTL